MFGISAGDFASMATLGLAGGLKGLMGGGGGVGYGPAAQEMAALSQQEFQDYMRRFVPEEDTLIRWATSPTTITDAVNKAAGIADEQQGLQQGMLGRRLSEYGITPDATQSADIQRQSQISGTASKIDAMNRAREETYQLQNTAMSGSTFSSALTGR